MRFGITMNNENECNSNDSAVGFDVTQTVKVVVVPETVLLAVSVGIVLFVMQHQVTFFVK